jgi:hypothetical protein
MGSRVNRRKELRKMVAMGRACRRRETGLGPETGIGGCKSTD